MQGECYKKKYNNYMSHPNLKSIQEAFKYFHSSPTSGVLPRHLALFLGEKLWVLTDMQMRKSLKQNKKS